MKLDYPVDLRVYCEDYNFDGFKISLSEEEYETCHELARIILGDVLDDNYNFYTVDYLFNDCVSVNDYYYGRDMDVQVFVTIICVYNEMISYYKFHNLDGWEFLLEKKKQLLDFYKLCMFFSVWVRIKQDLGDKIDFKFDMR